MQWETIACLFSVIQMLFSLDLYQMPYNVLTLHECKLTFALRSAIIKIHKKWKRKERLFEENAVTKVRRATKDRGKCIKGGRNLQRLVAF